MIAALTLWAAQVGSAKAIIDEAATKLRRCESMTVTRIDTTEEFPRERRVQCWWRRGGYLREDWGGDVQVSNPTQAWNFQPKTRKYRPEKPVGVDFDLPSEIGLDVSRARLPILAGPATVVWHKRTVLRIELDGHKAMTKETKLFVFYDPATHLPVGFSANLGSITQVTIFEDLRLNPKIDDSEFQFSPPPGWKRLPPAGGG